MTELADLSAVSLLTRYRAGDLSPVDVAHAVMARIARCEPVLRALYAYDPNGVGEAARASERRWRAGEARALEGVPVTIKENIATKGTPIPLGTAARELLAAPADAPPAARLREAGAIILAKTTMPDYGMLSSGASSFHPLTRNPWNTALNPGGSSAGAAAAGAAGYGPLHIGTDIGGSIRLPAGWCGLVGLKPSNGRVPIQPPYYGRVAGPMTRTVADAALAMRELSRPDGRDGMSLPPADLAFDGRAIDPKGLRIGFMPDAGIGLAVQPDVAEAVAAAARLFEGAGAIVEPMRPFLTRPMLDGLDDFWRTRAWSDIGPLTEAEQGRILPYILQWALPGRDMPGGRVLAGMNQMRVMADAALAACAPYDFVLSPVSPVVTYPAAMASPIDDPARPFEHIAFTVPFNMSEQPAVSIGLQIAGRRFDDEGVLGLAAFFEGARGPQRPWPLPC